MTELSKLEQELLEAIFPGFERDWTYDQRAKAAAIVCRKIAGQAFDAGGNYQLGLMEECERGCKNEYPNKDQWIKEHL